MDIDNIIKNPVVIGMFVGAITYIYLSWENEKKNKKLKKKGKEPEDVNLLIPLVVSLIGWFIANAYFSDKDIIQSGGKNNIILPTLEKVRNHTTTMPLPFAPQQNYKFVGDVLSHSSEPKSFSLLTGGVSIPKKLPDVMVDMF